MLFNSYEFLFLFLPATLLGYFWIARRGHEPAVIWLVVASLFFYGWWNPVYLLLLVASMIVNFGLGALLGQAHRLGRVGAGKRWLALGVMFNLSLLGYFKYANFAVNSLNSVAGTHLHLETIVLPLAISFFTFQQIAYLVDAFQGQAREYRFAHYALFVTFFPQLIAGPIVHHRDMLPQFMQAGALTPRAQNIAIGLSIFALGLFKKTVLADGVAQYATPVFNAAAAGESVTFFEAWGGALAYTLQLYFDFSGYSDMAVGAARMFGIVLPVNFHSPYKATNIIEFWRRWHMTLSAFLRDYLYVALGGNRDGRLKRYRNLMITMLLGGLWHGAGWTFVMWGALHGFYLCINHAWRHLSTRLFPAPMLPRGLSASLSWGLTFLAVVVGWVFFRAGSFDAAAMVLKGMAGLNGVALPNALAARLGGVWPVLEGLGFATYLGGGSQFVFNWLWVLTLLPIVLVMPNTQEIMRDVGPGMHLHRAQPKDEVQPLRRIKESIVWRGCPNWALTIGTLAGLGVLAMTSISEFLYFQF
ncbi:MBOAT family O-acyltransferase [Thauera propionica]|uniref:MBOAT family O-acyltransferase n=1 Tax=Thauera propionica TaxID=2019431 RepID=UPI0023F01808|nr:MBOAT family protein [Thauera propionica]MDD3674128.1 MBOAT family protein [Thauera propionica]